MPKFIAIGEAMVEMSLQTNGLYKLGFAGDTFNTAWYLKRNAPEIEVVYKTAAGDDEMSQRFCDFLAESRIVADVKTVPNRTLGLYLIALKNGERSFSYWRSQSAARLLVDSHFLLDARAGDVVYFSGITLAILDADSRARLLSTLAGARSGGVIIAFDPNLRPRLWNNVEEMCEWVMKGAEVSTLALPSYDDEEQNFGDADKEAALKRYRDAGCEIVILKDGAGEILIAHRDDIATFTPEPVANIVDTTAAGDSFNAGFLSSWLSGQSLTECAKAGANLAGYIIQYHGALID